MSPIRPHAPRPSPAQSALIDALDGPTAVAEMISERIGLDPPLTPQAVSMWRVRGIPHGYRMALALEARAREIAVPDGFLNGAQAGPADGKSGKHSENTPAQDDDVPAFLREGV